MHRTFERVVSGLDCSENAPKHDTVALQYHYYRYCTHHLVLCEPGILLTPAMRFCKQEVMQPIPLI